MKTQSATIPASIAATATTTTPVASGALAALPAGNAPAAPADFVASRLGRMVRPVRAQIDLTPKVVTELQSCADYTQLFGSAAPSVDSVVDALTLAKAWSGKLQNATAWYQFVKQEEHLAWKQALARTAALRVPFEFRLVRDASLAEDMPSTAAFFAITSDRAQKGAATRKEATAKEVKAAKATNAAAAAAPAAAPASAVVSDPVKAAALRLLN